MAERGRLGPRSQGGCANLLLGWPLRQLPEHRHRQEIGRSHDRRLQLERPQLGHGLSPEGGSLLRPRLRPNCREDRAGGGHYSGGPLLLDIRGGSLEGAGKIATGTSVAGELRPGNPLGTLEISQNWNHTNTPASKSVFQIGGTQKGVNYDHVLVGGTLNVGGELDIEFANAFEPLGSDVFELMRGLVRTGTFNATNAPSGFSPEVTYTTTNVTLRLIKTGVAAPTITTQPANLTVNESQNATFSVVATGTDLTYHWRKNGSAIGGATGPSLTFSPARFSDVATYSVVVANAGGSATSDNATLTLNPASIDSALVARYPFEGNLTDVTGGRNGTTNGIPTYVTNGARDRAVQFDGVSWITLGTDPSEAIIDSANGFSVSFWFRPRAVTGMVPFHLVTADGEFALYVSSGLNGDFPTQFGFRGHVLPATTDTRTYTRTFVGC
ncbi:MAG: hypothetical protein EXS36_12610 [Pedosphaera sp.]|nr:hypothetical protein [Pedosphaera sp.]